MDAALPQRFALYRHSGLINTVTHREKGVTSDGNHAIAQHSYDWGRILFYRCVGHRGHLLTPLSATAAAPDNRR